MRILVVENYRSTPLGLVGVALEEAGAEAVFCRAFEGEPVPADETGWDGLVILGGEQSALDDAGCPWLPGLAGLARTFGESGKAVLGICLGAQLVARGYGAQNILGRPIEFGWHAVRSTPEGRDDPVIAAIGDGAPLFHWHTDTFTLPPGAISLAASDLTEIQAFRTGRAVYGIQFHFEAGLAVVESWNEAFAAAIADHTPDWPRRFRDEANRHARHADDAGLALARRWVARV